ncbi:MAG: Ig-like domain-containing protein [Pseudomonadota bacterium]
MAVPATETFETGAAVQAIQAGGTDPLVVPGEAFLFTADFDRDGPDLILSGAEGSEIRVLDYFKTQVPADLLAENGAVLRGDLVERLAGPETPGQYAQAGAAAGELPIGQVEAVKGPASVQRTDGTVETLAVGVKIFPNDVLATGAGGGLSVTFSDGTTFTLAASSRMVIDELIYRPNGSGSTATFSLIEGGFVFIAGQVAKTGEMEVKTPAATMGIRGTTVLVDVQTDSGILTVEVALTIDLDGTVGQIELYDLEGNLIANITSTDTKWIISPENGEPREVPRTVEDDAADGLLIADAFAAYETALGRFDAGNPFVDQGDGSSAPLQEEDAQEQELFNPAIDEDSDIDIPSAPIDQPIPDGGDTFDQGELIDTDGLPEIADLAITALEDAVVVIAGVLPAAVTDAVFSVLSGPSNGTVALSSDGSFTYTPDANFFGTDTFTYQVTDGGGQITTATVTVNVIAVNDAPVGVDQTQTTLEDTVLTGSVTATDVDGDSLTYALAEGAENGTVVLVSDGSYSYTPNPDFFGSDSFTVTVSDGADGVDTITVSLDVTGVNDSPLVEDVSVGVGEDGSDFTVDLAEFANDPDNAPEGLSFSIRSAPERGDVSIDGSVLRFSPNGDFDDLSEGETRDVEIGIDVEDADGDVVEQTVTVTVTGSNDGPVLGAGTDAGSVTEAGTDDGTPSASGQLIATDPEGPISWSGSVAGALGAFLIAADGAWTYTLDQSLADSLAADDTVTETFTAIATDADGATLSQTVTITVTGANDAPAAVDAFVQTEAGETVSGQVVASDPDTGDTQVFTLGDTGPAHGTVIVNADGSFTYTADEDYSGPDSFEVVVTDALGATASATVFVGVERGQFEAPGGQSISVSIITTPTETNPAGSVVIRLSPFDGGNVNLVVALDSSGSIGAAGWEEQKAQVVAALTVLASQFAGSETSIDVQVISYSSAVQATATFDLLTQLDSLVATIEALPFQGALTNWADALSTAETFFDGQPTDEENILYFITDGNPVPSSQPWQAAFESLTNEVANGYSVDVQTFGVGAGYNPVLLDQIDSDGASQQVDSVESLTEAFAATPLFAAELIDFSLTLTVDGADLGEIANESSPELLPVGLSFELALADLDGLEALLGEQNIFSASAVFDVDGDSATTDDQVTLFTSASVSKADAAQSLIGIDGNDLLLGSDLSDSLDGAGGDDVILGYGGADILTPGAGVDAVLAGAGDDVIRVALAEAGDIVDGGAGRDTLELLGAGDVNATALSAIDLSGVEAIDMDNGAANTLALDLADVLGLSDTSDSSLEALLGAALGDSATIYGDDQDTLNLGGDGTNSFQLANGGVGIDDGAGNTIMIYELVGTGDAVLATVGVDADVTVNATAAAV